MFRSKQDPAPEETEETPPDPLWAIDALVADSAFQGRVRASIARESEYGTIPPQTDPVQAAFDKRYLIAATPGFGADYAYAVETGNQHPGTDPVVIGDDEIASAVVAKFPHPEAPSDEEGAP